MKALRKIFPVLAAALFFAPASWAQAQETSETEYKTAPPQPGDTAARINALDYLLQKPQVAKRYEDKSFADRFFLEMGVGLNNTLTRSSSTYIDWKRFGFSTDIAVGDWITPEHGVRLAFEGHLFRHKYIPSHVKAFGFSADYLMNFTAIGNRSYDKPHRYELIGMAGLDLLHSHLKGNKRWAPGFHLALRGQANVSRYTYLYIEPRATLYSENLLQHDSRYGWRPTLSLMAGMGYRLVPGTGIEGAKFTSSGMLLENSFLSFSAGPGVIASGQRKYWKNQVGARASLGLGKWFSPSSGLRLGFTLLEYKQGRGNPRVKGGSVSLDYMLNMHNVFGGYNPDRTFFINALAGASYNYVQTGSRKRWLPGLGFALQPNVRVGRATTLFLEPRADFYPKKFAAHAYTAAAGDITMSLLAGVTFQQRGDMSAAQQRNRSFTNKRWYDHAFIDASVGLSLPLRVQTLRHIGSTLSPVTHIGVGKWFNALSGLRLKAEAGRAEWEVGKSNTFVSIGADYMWNISNLTYGYRSGRHFELVALAGVDAVSPRFDHKLYLGANLGFKGLWNVSPAFSLFLEPQVYGYDNAFLPGTTSSSFKIDLLANLSAGMQFNLNAPETPAAARYDRPDVRVFYMLSAGAVSSANGITELANAGVTARAGFGQWYSPMLGWRVTLGSDVIRHKQKPRNFYGARITAGADYLVDITAATFGEDEDRTFILRALGGANLGVLYEQGKTHFCPDVHAGLQLAARLGTHGWEIFAEPTMAYLTYSPLRDKFYHIQPGLQIGLNYQYRRGDRSGDGGLKSNFVEAAFGLGAYSGTFSSAVQFKRKLTLTYGAAYGRRISKAGAVRVGITQTHIHKTKPGRNGSDLTALHADYMHELLPNLDAKFHLRGVAGINIDRHKMKTKTRWGGGIGLGVQAAYAVGGGVEVFAEPTVNFISRSVTPHHTNRPFEGEGKLLMGTRINF